MNNFPPGLTPDDIDRLVPSPQEIEAWEDSLRSKRGAMPLRDLGSGRIPLPPPLFEGLVLDRTLTLVSSEPHCYKTFLLINMMICLDLGKPLFDRFPTPHARRSLYIAADSPKWDIAQQATKLIRGMGLRPEEIDMLESDILMGNGLSITDPHFLQWVKDWKNSSDFEVLFIDTLRKVHQAEENDSRQMGAVMDILRRLRDDLGLCVIVNQHVSKPGLVTRSKNYNIRGSSDIAGSIDWHLQLERVTGGVHLSGPKARAGAHHRPADFTFTLDEFDLPSGEEACRLSVGTPVAQTVLAVLGDRALTRKDIISETAPKLLHIPEDKRTKVIDNAVQQLRRADKITNTDGHWSLK